MERSSKMEMDMEIEEWELLPDKSAFFDLGFDTTGKDLYSKELRCDPRQIMDLNYFICPPEKTIPSVEKKQLLPNPITHSSVADKYEDDDEVIQCFRDIGVAPPPVIFANRDYASHVAFKKKMDEDDQFCNMKLSSPKSLVIPQMEPETIVYEEKEACKDQEFLKNMEFIQEKMAYKEESFLKEEEGNKDACVGAAAEKNGKPCWEGFGLQIWRWRLDGIGTLCSIGVAAAAAAICMFILGGRQRQRQQHQHQHQRIQFQIYAEDRRIKQVMQQATRLNQAFMRNVPISRAQISFGGYYDGL